MSFTFYDIYKALKKLSDFYFPVIVGEIKKYFSVVPIREAPKVATVFGCDLHNFG